MKAGEVRRAKVILQLAAGQSYRTISKQQGCGQDFVARWKARFVTFVDDAVNKGARVVNAGGGTACETLYFPAAVYPVRSGMELYTKEQFGPVVPVCAYQDEQEFLDYVHSIQSRPAGQLVRP